ncbi:MAG: DNA glycosylase [candidate division WOR-3 bacterium]
MRRYEYRVPDSHLNLHYTLFSGQCFGWDADKDGFRGFFRWKGATRGASLRRRGEMILSETDAPEDWFWEYFNLSININDVYASFPNDPKLNEAVKRFRGMRVLRQDPWEVTVSFVISQNNNIKRIRLILRRMIREFGRFPEPEDLASEDALLRLGLGYRARYLVRISEKVLRGEFNPETHQSKASLLCLPGVGEKVARCILLYGYGENSAFPIDRWIKRFGGPKIDYGPYAGWAQLYLYVMAREGVREPG